MARVVTVVGLLLLWGLVWANLPSQDELRSMPVKQGPATPPMASDLDLSIPGVPSPSALLSGPAPGASSTTPDDRAPFLAGSAEFTNLAGVHARQVAEVKCEAEVQQFCPENLTGDARRHCVERRMTQLTPLCRQIVRQRIVRWKDAEGYKLACLDDLQRLCPRIHPGDGRILQCLQEHAQEVSDRCHQSLPKGHLLVRQ
jgi:hypothetical protein